MHPFQVYMLCAMFSILGEDYCQIFSVVDLHVGPCWLFSNNALAYIIVWLTTPMGKMKQILCSDWPCEPIFAAWDCLHWSHAKKKNCVKQAYKGYNLCTMSGHTTEDSNNKENTLNKFHDLNLVQKATLFPRTQKSKSFVILIKPKSFCHYMINPWYIYQLKL